MSTQSPASPGDDGSSAETATGRDAPVGAKRSRRRRTLFRLIVVLLPFAALGAGEAVCRWRGYGGYPPVIRYVGFDGSRHWYSTYRPGVDSFFYQQLSHTGGMRTFAFTTPKPTGTVRIGLFGGSAMQGYPQPLPLTNGAFLEAMLRDVWGPNRRVEVLNFGATAMASFPAMHFLEEMLPHQLDLVVVMCGNNEFYGAYGVASLHRAGTSPAGMRFMRAARSLALKQWLDDRLLRPPADEQVRKQPLMKRVAAVQQIGPDDGLRRAAQWTLSAHLNRMVDRCVEHGVPVIVCTVPTNERGMAPIGEDIAPPLPAGQRETFDRRLAWAESMLEADPAAAAEALRQALGDYASHARAHYLLGRALTALGEHDDALEEYVAARDLDAMPWRAPSWANDAARRAAARGGILCDMEAAFRAESPGGAIGWTLMDDHVHMSLRGQALFARVIAQAMAKLPEPLRVDPAAMAALPGWETYAARQGATLFDELTAAQRMKTLFEIDFMSRSNPQALEAVTRRYDALLASMSERDREAARHWEDPGLHVTNHRPITGVVGYYRLMDGDYEGAAPLFRIARECVANVSLWRLQYTWYLIDCQRHLHAEPTDEDRRLVAEAIEIGELLGRFVGFPDPLGPSFLGMAYHVAGRHREAVALLDDAVRYARGREGIEVVRALAGSLVEVGQVDRAMLLLELAVRDADIAPMAKAILADLRQRFPDARPATRAAGGKEPG